MKERQAPNFPSIVTIEIQTQPHDRVTEFPTDDVSHSLNARDGNRRSSSFRNYPFLSPATATAAAATSAADSPSGRSGRGVPVKRLGVLDGIGGLFGVGEDGAVLFAAAGFERPRPLPDARLQPFVVKLLQVGQMGPQLLEAARVEGL